VSTRDGIVAFIQDNIGVLISRSFIRIKVTRKTNLVFSITLGTYKTSSNKSISNDQIVGELKHFALVFVQIQANGTKQFLAVSCKQVFLSRSW